MTQIDSTSRLNTHRMMILSQEVSTASFSKPIPFRILPELVKQKEVPKDIEPAAKFEPNMAEIFILYYEDASIKYGFGKVIGYA
mmetsp:Transcript_7941/g.13334  ORF Transcript_7941/g.13334 Transcript_7941/m.13334 type:complete len:84 (+) Transcript_7941:297-548(+)